MPSMEIPLSAVRGTDVKTQKFWHTKIWHTKRVWDEFGHYLEQEIAPVEQILVLEELTRITSIQHKHN